MNHLEEMADKLKKIIDEFSRKVSQLNIELEDVALKNESLFLLEADLKEREAKLFNQESAENLNETAKKLLQGVEKKQIENASFFDLANKQLADERQLLERQKDALNLGLNQLKIDNEMLKKEWDVLKSEQESWKENFKKDFESKLKANFA